MEKNLSIVKDNFKELPNNIEAEQAVIGSILVSNDIFDEKTVIRTVKARLMILRKKRSSQNLSQFPNKGNGFDV